MTEPTGVVGESGVAPLDRPGDGALARREVRRGRGQDVQARPQSVLDSGESEQTHAGGCQLQREGDAVEEADHAAYLLLVARQSEGRSARLDPFDEQFGGPGVDRGRRLCGRLRHIEGRNGNFVLTVESEAKSAGDEDGEVGRRGGQRDDEVGPGR